MKVPMWVKRAVVNGRVFRFEVSPALLATGVGLSALIGI